MLSRTAFEDLPASVQSAVESLTGPILCIEPVPSGHNSQLAARLSTKAGEVHVKGLRQDHQWVWTQQREADVTPYLTGLASALRWRITISGWDLVGFDHLSGPHADYAPGSPDLPLVADLLTQLGERRCPPVELREAGQRLSAYAENPSDVAHFQGDALLHTDLNNENVLISNEVAYLVDWAWATKGAAWLDAAYWVIWLIAAGGHSPQSAETWAAKVPAWGQATPQGLDAFALANENLWREIAGDDPGPWAARMVRAAEAWARYRTRP